MSEGICLVLCYVLITVSHRNFESESRMGGPMFKSVWLLGAAWKPKLYSNSEYIILIIMSPRQRAKSALFTISKKLSLIHRDLTKFRYINY